MGYHKIDKIYEPLILEPEDWTPEEYKVLKKLFSVPDSAERIMVTYSTVEYFVDGSKDWISENYTPEYCPWCDSEQIIYANGITACPNCGRPLAPCSVCGDCKDPCPYGCTGGPEDEHKPIDRYISEEEVNWYMKTCY